MGFSGRFWGECGYSPLHLNVSSNPLLSFMGNAGLPCPGSSAGAESEGEVALRDLRITELRWRIFFAPDHSGSTLSTSPAFKGSATTCSGQYCDANAVDRRGQR